MHARRSVVAVAALWLGAVLAAPAWAGQPADQLSASIDRIITILNDPELKRPVKAKQRQAAVRRMASEVFDFEEFARRSLGRHWDARTPAEQAEFVQLFRLLLERVLTGKLDLYNGEKIVVVGDVIDGVRGDERFPWTSGWSSGAATGARATS